LIAKATDRLTGDNQNLRKKVLAQEEPYVSAICQTIAKNLGVKTLSSDQYTMVARVLGHPISVGRKLYDPTPRDEILLNEEDLRIASQITQAFETLAGAPPAEAVAAATWPVQRKQHRRAIDGIIEWATAYRAVLACMENEDG
jgi:hypothetical protein